MLRHIVLLAAALGAARLCGFSVVEWAATAATLMATACSTLLGGAWQLLLQPSSEPTTASLPDLHQAVLNVTRDATRVADLLEDFMDSYREDPELKAKFMSFMAAQANTSYSVVDNQLSWVLWLYSMIWMPLLVVMCLARASRAAAGSSQGGRAQQAAAAARYGPPPPAPGWAGRQAAAAATPRLDGREEPAHAGQPMAPRASADAAGAKPAGRSIQRSATVAAPAARAQDQGQPRQPHGKALAVSASLPAHSNVAAVGDVWIGSQPDQAAGLRPLRSVKVRAPPAAA